MARKQPSDTHTQSSRIRELIEQLTQVQNALQESIGGEIDSVLDTTGRPVLLQQAQEALQESEALQKQASDRLQAIFDSLPANIVLIDQNGLIASFNEHWRRFAIENGWPRPEEAIGSDYLAVCRNACGEDEPVAKRIGEGIKAVLQGKLPEYHDEYPCSSPDQFRWFQVLVSPYDSDAETNGALVMHIDITERKQTEQSRERLFNIVETTTDVVGIIAPRGYIVYLNRAGRQLLGLEESEEVSQYHFSQFCPNWTYNLMEREVVPTVMDKGLWEGEVGMLTGNGEERMLSSVAFPQQAANGDVEYICSISRDITEQKRSQEESRLLAHLALNIEQEYDLHSSLEIVLREVCKMTGWTLGEAWLPCQDQTCLRCSPAWHSSEPGLEPFRRKTESLFFRKGEGLPGIAWRTGRYVWNENIVEDPLFHRSEAAKAAGLKCGVGFPVQLDKETVAVLVFFFKEDRPKDHRLIYLVSAVTTQLGAVVERKKAQTALRESEQKFRQLAENIEEVFWILDLQQQRVIYVSLAYETIWGKSRQSLYDDPTAWLHSIHPDDQEQVRATRGTDRITKTRHDIEYRIVRPDGDVRWIKDRSFPLFDNEGEVWRITGIAEDFTERKLAEEEKLKVIEDLNERVKELRAIHHTAHLLEDETISIDTLVDRLLNILKPAWQYPDVTAIRVRAGDLEKASPGFTETSWRQTAAIVTQQGVTGEIQVVYTEPKPTADEGPFLREEREMLESIADMLGVFFDRRHANQEKERLAAFPRENPNPTLEFNPEGEVTFFNDSVAELTRELGRELVQDVLPPDTTSIVKECLRSGQSKTQMEARLDDRTISWSFFPVLNNQLVHCYGTDVTEKQQLQEQFFRAQRMESLGTLASGVAHDMNNILSPIRLATQLLDNQISDPKQREWLNRITVSVDRGAQITKQLVTFGRGVNGKEEPVDARELFKGLKNITLATFPKNIRIENDIPGSLWRIQGDVTQLHQVLLNLCVNARDAMPDGGTLRIKAENQTIQDAQNRQSPEFKPGKYIVIEITDTGCGIPPDIIHKVTEPFFTTKSAEGGSGLGLSTVAGLIQSHNGYLEIESSVGRGTTFRVLLPALEEEVKQPSKETEKTLPKGHEELILIVDDEAQVREMTSAMIESHGYKAVTAANGSDALSLFSEQPEQVRLVLTDLFMPSMDGVELVRALKQTSSSFEVIVMTGYIDQARVDRLKEMGIEAILEKPFSQTKLIEMIHRVLA